MLLAGAGPPPTFLHESSSLTHFELPEDILTHRLEQHQGDNSSYDWVNCLCNDYVCILETVHHHGPVSLLLHLLPFA